MGNYATENNICKVENELAIWKRPDIERALLGAVILDEGGPLLARLRRELDPLDISTESFRAIYEAVCDLADRGESITPHWIEDALRQRGTHASASGNLPLLINGSVRMADPGREIQALKTARARLDTGRRLQGYAGKALSPDTDLADLAERVHADLSALVATHSGRPPIAKSWAEMAAIEYPTIEAIVHATPRGGLLMCAAMTNKGKSTFWRNASICLAAGRKYPPLVEKGPPRKVLYLDFEWPEAGVQREIKTMLDRLSTDERADVARNLHIVANDVEIDGQTINLSNLRHLRAVENQAHDIGADIIVVDTLTAGFDIGNENDNSEAAHVCKILRGLARRLKCVIVFLHHVGKTKSEEGQTSEAAHRARGGSAYAGFAHTIINILPERDIPGRVVIESAKCKGVPFERTAMTLDQAARWFDAAGAAPAPVDPYQNLLAKFNGAPLKRADIAEKTSLPKTTLSRLLDRATKSGDLVKTDHGAYQKPPNAQMPNPIGMDIWAFDDEAAQPLDSATDREDTEL